MYTLQNAVLSYDAQIAPYTPIIVGALSSILNNLTDQPMQLLRVINQYAELVKRDDVRRNMNTEREILLGHLIRTVATMGVEVRSRFKVLMKYCSMGHRILIIHFRKTKRTCKT